jgi:hypothetical protein
LVGASMATRAVVSGLMGRPAQILRASVAFEQSLRSARPFFLGFIGVFAVAHSVQWHKPQLAGSTCGGRPAIDST